MCVYVFLRPSLKRKDNTLIQCLDNCMWINSFD